MLQLGQHVRIGDEPNYGYSYFDSDDIGTEDWIRGIRKVGVNDYAYQLYGEDDDCWWLEDELYDYENVRILLDGTPIYGIDDMVVEQDEPQAIKTITAVIEFNTAGRTEFVYELDDEGAYVDECELTLYSKSGTDTPNYTLF